MARRNPTIRKSRKVRTAAERALERIDELRIKSATEMIDAECDTLEESFANGKVFGFGTAKEILEKLIAADKRRGK